MFKNTKDAIDFLTKEDSFILIPYAIVRIFFIMVLSSLALKWEFSNNAIEYIIDPLKVYGNLWGVQIDLIKSVATIGISSVVALLGMPLLIEAAFIDIVNLFVLILSKIGITLFDNSPSKDKIFLLEKYQDWPMFAAQRDISQARKLFEIIKNIFRIALILVLFHFNWLNMIGWLFVFYIVITWCNRYDNIYNDVLETISKQAAQL